MFEKKSITSERLSIRHETQCNVKSGGFFCLTNIIIQLYFKALTTLDKLHTYYIYIYIYTAAQFVFTCWILGYNFYRIPQEQFFYKKFKIQKDISFLDWLSIEGTNKQIEKFLKCALPSFWSEKKNSINIIPKLLVISIVLKKIILKILSRDEFLWCWHI